MTRSPNDSRTGSRISRRLIEAVKLSREPAYALAWKAGVHPSVLSKLLHGAERVRDRDPRVLAIARVVGIPAREAFDSTVRGAR